MGFGWDDITGAAKKYAAPLIGGAAGLAVAGPMGAAAGAEGADQLFDGGQATQDFTQKTIPDAVDALSGKTSFSPQYFSEGRTTIGDPSQGALDQQGYAQDISQGYAQSGDQFRGMGGSLYNAGLNAQNRQGAQESQWQSNQEGQARGQQQYATDLALQAASGNAPSEAAYVLQQGLDQAAAAQQSQASSARGLAALSNAQGNAAGMTAGLQADAFTGAGRLRAQEMANARGLAGSLTSNLRQGDQSRLQQGNDMSRFNRQQNDAYGLGLLGQGQGYAGLGQGQDQTGLGYAQLGQGYYGIGNDNARAQAQLDAQREANNVAGRWRQQDAQLGIDKSNAQAQAGFYNKLIGAGEGLAKVATAIPTGGASLAGGVGMGGSTPQPTDSGQRYDYSYDPNDPRHRTA